MEEFKKLLGVAWNLGKAFYTQDIKTIEQYNNFTEYGNGLLKEYKPDTKEHRFIKAIVSAVDIYCMEDWQEKHNIQ